MILFLGFFDDYWIIIVAAIIGLLNWIAERSAEIRRKSLGKPPKPEEKAPESRRTIEEARRRADEAHRREREEPEPARPRAPRRMDLGPRPEAPAPARRPAEPQPRPEPVRRPQPAPEPRRRPVTVRPVREPRRMEPTAGEARLPTMRDMARGPFEYTPGGPESRVEPLRAPRTRVPEERIRRILRGGTDSLREAIVLREVLGPPVARRRRGRRP